jgi:hypothetical protein
MFGRALLGAFVVSVGCVVGDVLPADAAVLFKIEWLEEDWSIVETTAGSGIYESHTSVELHAPLLNDAATQTPTLKARTTATGKPPERSTSEAEIRVTRPFRIVRDDSAPVPVALTGDVSGYYNKDVMGKVKWRARAEVSETALVYDQSWERTQGHESLTFSDAFSLDGSLNANHTYTLNGYAHALADSDNISTSHNNKAFGTLDFHSPISVTDPIDQRYYDLRIKEWDWHVKADADDNYRDDLVEFTSEQIGAWVGSGVTGPWSYLVSWGVTEGLEAAFETGGRVEVIDYEFNDGVAFTYARGKLGGHAHASIYFDTEFELVPDPTVPARLEFDGWLDGLLESDLGTAGYLETASVSVAGTGLEWELSSSAADGESQRIDESINAWGLALPDTIYTFESTLKLRSEAGENASDIAAAMADFGSSFGGVLSVAPIVPEPSSLVIFLGLLTGLWLFRSSSPRLARYVYYL